MKRQRRRQLALGVLLLTALVVGVYATTRFSTFSTSGLQGVRATWQRLEWNGESYPLSDPTHAVIDLTDEGVPAPFLADWTRYQLETDQPKYEEVLRSETAWFNTSDEARWQEVRLERWTLSVDLYALSAGGAYSPAGVKFILRLETNPDAIFVDANRTTSYVVHAYVQEYQQLGTQTELVLPSQGAFTLYFPEGGGSPDIPENTFVDPDALGQYAVVEIQFETSDFGPVGSLWWWTDAHVHYVIALDVVVIGQWIWPLDEALGGENRAGGGTKVSPWDAAARALGDAFSALGDWLNQFWWVIPIVIISVATLVLLVLLRGIVPRR